MVTAIRKRLRWRFVRDAGHQRYRCWCCRPVAQSATQGFVAARNHEEFAGQSRQGACPCHVRRLALSGAYASPILWREAQATLPCNDGLICWTTGTRLAPDTEAGNDRNAHALCTGPRSTAWGRERFPPLEKLHSMPAAGIYKAFAVGAQPENSGQGAPADVAVSLAVLLKKRQKFRSVVGFRPAHQ